MEFSIYNIIKCRVEDAKDIDAYNDNRILLLSNNHISQCTSLSNTPFCVLSLRRFRRGPFHRISIHFHLFTPIFSNVITVFALPCSVKIENIVDSIPIWMHVIANGFVLFNINFYYFCYNYIAHCLVIYLQMHRVIIQVYILLFCFVCVAWFWFPSLKYKRSSYL